MTNVQSIPSIYLLDGTRIPWLGWGNGTGLAGMDALKAGQIAIDAGIRHIDTVQSYQTEEATGHVVSSASLSKDEIYVTSKCTLHCGSLALHAYEKTNSEGPGIGKVALGQVRQSVESSVEKNGFIFDLFLIHNPFVAFPGELMALWQMIIFEALKDKGKPKSIGVSNFRMQDLEALSRPSWVAPSTSPSSTRSFKFSQSIRFY